ncbi:DUF7948 domain-containing protein [Flavobacterium psychrotolerans]|uniref:DUF7948 domain-containing protein n=1 Tax=Flavobacterium psychrotolerans TaxID=2169410 RepID=A0A2U1JR27_9FLAO|nr:T9SS type B sorting domain-containing protein [Flavobacterium psychrotolerans]PWA07409.1 hypothetical protein DB895_01445 [Flavobacterium psychrotolerans]
MKYKLLAFITIISFHLFSQNKNQSIGFTENKGQIINQKGKPNPAVKFLLNSSGLNVQLRKNGFSYDVYETKKHPLTEKQKKEQHPTAFPDNDKDRFPDYTLEYIYHRIDIDFVDSNPNVEFIKEGESADYDNYYNIVNRPEGITNVHKFKQLTYKNIYPNIDVVFSIPKDSLKTVEYNFVVHPGGKTSDIQMKFKGAQTDLVDNKIRIKVRFGEMEETLPMSWTENGNEKTDIAIGYRKIKKNVYGFESTDSVSDKRVIIDPVPVRLWGTYYGGEGLEISSSVFAKDGFVYWAVITYSSENIASVGAHQNYYASNGGYDAFFTKLNSDGTRVWGTYYGGAYADIINQIKVSNNDNIYIAGETLSKTNISTIGSHQQNSGDPVWNTYDGFLVKFESNGIRQWGTYYGDLNDERINSLIIDSNEKIYISGETSSDKSIATIGSYQPNHTNQSQYPYDGFIAKFNSDGVREWGTYCGGNKRDTILDSKLDSNGNLILMGSTNSTLGISTSNAYQEINNGADGFLMKFDLNGNRIWSTYFGGNNDDYFYNLGIDSSDNLYCFGQTNSTANIATTGVFQEIYLKNSIANNSGCIFKFDSNGFKMWGSYFFPETLGGSVSKSGDIYFTGRVENGFLPTPNAYQEIRNLGTESYLVKFNTNGQRDWATYFGGIGADNAFITSADDNFNIYLAGLTNSLTNIATPNTYQPNRYPDTNFYTFNTGDAFLVKFRDCFSSTTTSSNSPICIGSSLELKASGGTNYSWTGPNGFTSNEQNPIILKANAANSGQYNCAITGTGGCDATNIIDILVNDTITPIPNISKLPTITGTCNATVSTIPTATDNCAGTITGTTTNPLIYDLAGTYTIVWNYKDGNGNNATQNQKIIVNPNADVIVPEVTYSLCDGDIDGKEIFDLTSKQPAIINLPNYSFSYFKNENDALLQTNKIINLSNFENETNPQTIFVRVLNTVNNCSSLSKIILTINPKPVVSNGILSKCDTFFNGIQTFDLDIAKTQINASANLTFQYFKSLQDLNNGLEITNPNSFLNAINNQIVHVKVSDSNTCFAVAELTLVINPIDQKILTDFIKCDDDYDGKVIFDFSEKYNEISTYLPTDNYTYSYYTNIKDASLGNSNTIAALYSNTINNEIIYIRVLGTSGCSSIFKVKLVVLVKPKVNMKDNWSICKGVSILIAADAGFNSYLWSTGAITQSILVKESGDYSVTVTKNHDTISCSTTKNIAVVASSKAVITKIETVDWTDSQNMITIFTTGDGNYEYSINGIDFQDSNIFSGLTSGIYTVYVNDKNGCGITKDEVYILLYSNFFTPNGDGFNDYWNIKFSFSEPTMKIKIFNRYGKLVKELAQNGLGWDGTFEGQELPSSDYWFIVSRANGKEYRGHFSLKR